MTLAFSDAPLVAEPPPTPPMLFGFSDLNCALTSTSILGSVYAASPLKDVMTGSVTWHDACARHAPAPVPRCLGQVRLVSQVSRTPRPVLVPPWNVRPLASRAFSETFTPCQYCVRAGPKSVSNVLIRLRADRPQDGSRYVTG